MKLIDKAALVARIKRRIKHYNLAAKEFGDESYKDNVLMEQCKASACKRILSFIDTLEVKEVDLEKEIDEVIHNYKLNNHRYTSICALDIEWIAEHFFELGLKARIDKELVDEVYSHIDSIKDTADRMTSGNFMHHKAAIKFSTNPIAKVLELIGLKAQKGK